MYSPKIKEELIPKIYEIARAKHIPMTVLVKEILQKTLNEIKYAENKQLNKSRKEV